MKKGMNLKCEPFADNDNFNGVSAGVPSCHKVKLTYASYVNFGLASGTFGQQLVSGNSLFDPDATAVGEQPYWFDTWKIMYGKYRVYKSKIELRIINTGSVVADVVCAPTVPGTNVGDIYEMRELPRARAMVCGSINGVGLARCNMKYHTATIIGVNESAISDEEDYAALVSANPAARWYWNIGCQGIGAYTSTIGITVEYRVTYFAVMYQPTLAGDSVALRHRISKPTITGVSGPCPNRRVGGEQSSTTTCTGPQITSESLRYHSVQPTESTDPVGKVACDAVGCQCWRK